MWNAAEGGAFPFPHVQVLRFKESDRSLLSQDQIWNNQHAWMYPSIHPNDRGHLGRTIAFGGGNLFPGTAAWIADDFNDDTMTPLDNVVFSTGNSGPASNRWGDYLTTCRHVPYGNTWTGSGYAHVGGPNPNDTVPRYVWFGRERDMPPTRNTIYVDLTNVSGYEDGSAAHPFNTIMEGHFAAMDADQIIIQAGIYDETVTFSSAVIVTSSGGTTVIGGSPATISILSKTNNEENQ